MLVRGRDGGSRDAARLVLLACRPALMVLTGPAISVLVSPVRGSEGEAGAVTMRGSPMAAERRTLRFRAADGAVGAA